MMPSWTHQDLREREGALRRAAEGRRRRDDAARDRRTPPVEEIAVARTVEVCPEPCLEAPLAHAG